MTSKARNIADLGSNDVIETTATGVDVTGTVTADGLTVDGTIDASVGGSSFDMNDANGYPRFSQASGSAQLGLFRTATSAGGGYIGADETNCFDVRDGTSLQTKMVVSQSGNVGIGTASPSNNLAIYESSTGNAGIDIDNTQSGTALTLGKQGSTAYGATSAGDGAMYVYDASLSIMADGGAGNTSSIKFSTGGNAERARIDSSGKLLVNTTTATDAQLTVKSDSGLHPAIKVSDGGANGYTLIADNYTANDSQVNLGVMHASASAVLSWGVKPSDTTDSYVSSTGLYSKPPQALEMDAEGIKFLQGANAQVATDSAVTMSERMRIDNNGNLLLGTTVTPTTNASSGNSVASMFSTSSHTVPNVSSTFVNSGFSIGNTRASYLVTVSGGAPNNGSAIATYIFTKAAYDAELVQLGNGASHFNNVHIEAALDSSSSSTVNLQVRFTGTNLTGTGTIVTNAIRIG